MKNKCPKCGFEYGEFDVYCSRCGYKIKEEENFKNIENTETFVKKTFLDNFKNALKDKDTKKAEFFDSSKRGMYDTAIFNFVICMLIISCILSCVLFFVTNKQKNHKAALQYKNLITNPAQIPELKEPASFKELVENLGEVEKFLLLYLKYSNDSIEKKEQIFASYLREMDKLPHITSENMVKDDKDSCSNIKTTTKAKICAAKITREFKKTGITAYSDFNTVYLYPDNVYIKNTYSKYLSKPMKEYLALKAKYNTPTSVGLNLYIKPIRLADKIYDFETLFLSVDNSYIKEEAENIIYDDFRKFIFTPSIYATTTQEMTKDFKKAYNYFIRTKKNSALRPVVMSYLDKKRSYGEDNFKNDYPYKIYKNSFNENVENNAFSDIFVQLRKNIFAKNSDFVLTHVYNITRGVWSVYNPQVKIDANDIVIGEADENNNVSIYDNTFALLQELNISKYGQIFLVNGKLYIFNRDKLSISKITYNGRQFVIQNLSATDVLSVFPGIEIINIDSYSNYNIFIEKDNLNANFIILSRYSQGYSEYKLSALKGAVKSLILPNMFAVSSNSDVVVAFHGKNVNPEETSESAPTYKFTIHTRGEASSNEDENSKYVQYDEETARDESLEESKHTPQIMPKIKTENETSTVNEELLSPAPSQNLEPPNEND